MVQEKQVEASVYEFDPESAGVAQRFILLEESEVAIAPPPEPPVTAIEPAATNANQRWSKLVQDILTPDVLTQLIVTLRDASPLPDQVTSQLFDHLIKVYRHKVAELLQSQGLEAIDTRQPHLKLVTNRKQNSKTLELVFNDDKIKAYLKNSLSEFFTHAGFWEEFARTIGTNLVIWAIERIETDANPQDLVHDQLRHHIRQLLLKPDSAMFQERISFLAQIYSQDITKRIIQSFNLPACSLQDMDNLLGLRQKPSVYLDTALKLDPITVLPTSIPIASSIRAQLRPDLWQKNADELAVFQYRSKSNPTNYIEHYITNPGDIDLLPWEAAEQIINKFGFDTVKLQLIFAARAMDEDEPWNSAFTMRATDMVQLLGWDRNHSTSLPQKRNAVATTAYALSCLLVKSVWIEGRGNRKVDASTPTGRMWDVLIDSHGQIDWVTGKIEKPDEIYITVSPGLWTKHFLNRAGNKAKQALHQFGYLAKDILKIDPYHNELALRLAIQLTLDARIRAKNENPYDYRVVSLLEDVLPRTEIERALQDKHRARDLKNRWNNALHLLISLGWQIEFDPETYPAWLQPDSDAPKPDDWRKVKIIERLLQAKLTIKPPHPIPDLLNRLREPKKPKQVEAPTPAEELTGHQVQQGRENRGWSRKELGGFLDLSADYIGKLERGDRVITPELETKLRRLLHLS